MEKGESRVGASRNVGRQKFVSVNHSWKLCTFVQQLTGASGEQGTEGGFTQPPPFGCAADSLTAH